MGDLDFRITISHGVVTHTATLDCDQSNIYDVVEALDYALRGVGFDVELIHKAFSRYGAEDG